MSKIYTCKGDTGITSLANGDRVAKNHPRIAAYGKTDELVAWLGLIRSYPEFCRHERLKDLAGFLRTIQEHLIHLASELAYAGEQKHPGYDFSKATTSLEATIDMLESQLPVLHAFILPANPSLSSIIHIARTVCRETERLTVALGTDIVNAGILTYLNRLSDFLFVLARFVTFVTGCEEDFFV
jgi:cob(I)alamin adenosyltransferase